MAQNRSRVSLDRVYHWQFPGRPTLRKCVTSRLRLVSLIVLLIAVSALGQRQPQESRAPTDKQRRTFVRTPVGQFDSTRLTESSGIVKSRVHEGIFWTHNDSGHSATLFAVRENGEVVAEIPVAGASNYDWEDITLGDDGRLFIGDIGDNVVRRSTCEIYEVDEPNPLAHPGQPAQVTRVLRFRMPNGPVDSEALFFWRGELYLITKQVRERPVLYLLKENPDNSLTPSPICTIPLAPITSADVARDGRQLVVCSYGQVAVFDLGKSLASLATAKPVRLSMPIHKQTEACCFDGRDVIVTAESGEIWRIGRKEIDANRP